MSYLKHVSMLAFTQGVATLLAFFYTLVAARTLSLSDYGLFQSLMGVYGLLIAVTLPLNLAIVHCVSKAPIKQHPEILSGFFKLSLIVSIPAFLVVLLLADFLSKLLAASSMFPMLFIGLLMLSTAVLTVFYGYLQGKKRFGDYSKAKLIQVLSCLFIGSLLMQTKNPVSGAILGYVISMLFLILYFIKSENVRVVNGSKLIKDEMRAIARITTCLILIFLIDGAGILTIRARFDEHQSGQFGALYNLRNMLWPFVISIVLPFYSHANTDDTSKPPFWKAFILIVVICCIFILSGFVFHEWIFNLLYGEAYLDAAQFMGFYGIHLLFEFVALLIMFHRITLSKSSYLELIFPIVILITGMAFWVENILTVLICQSLASLSYIVYTSLGLLINRRIAYI